MEILTEQITEINNYLDFEKILKLLYTCYDRETRNKIYEQTEQELKGTENEHNLKVLNENYFNNCNDYYNSLGLYNLKLKDNEQDYYYLSDLMENLTESIKKYSYLYELNKFNEYGYYIYYFMENNFKFNIKSEYHIIIDYENKKIFNLNEDNETEIINKLIKLNDLNNNDSIKLLYLQQENEYNKTIEYNTTDNRQLYNLSFDNCKYYNEKDKYIIIDNIKNKWTTVYNVEVTETEILKEILQDNEQIINYIIDNI